MSTANTAPSRQVGVAPWMVLADDAEAAKRQAKREERIARQNDAYGFWRGLATGIAWALPAGMVVAIVLVKFGRHIGMTIL